MLVQSTNMVVPLLSQASHVYRAIPRIASRRLLCFGHSPLAESGFPRLPVMLIDKKNSQLFHTVQSSPSSALCLTACRNMLRIRIPSIPCATTASGPAQLLSLLLAVFAQPRTKISHVLAELHVLDQVELARRLQPLVYLRRLTIAANLSSALAPLWRCLCISDTSRP